MRLKQIYDTIALVSPYVEILLRRLYWRNVDKLGKFNPNKVTNQNREPKNEHSDFEKVLNWLKLCGIREGDIVDEKGNFMGRHKGIIHYTIGQRKGLAFSRPGLCMSAG